jgi:hypothetical protein
MIGRELQRIGVEVETVKEAAKSKRGDDRPCPPKTLRNRSLAAAISYTPAAGAVKALPTGALPPEQKRVKEDAGGDRACGQAGAGARCGIADADVRGSGLGDRQLAARRRRA